MIRTRGSGVRRAVTPLVIAIGAASLTLHALTSAASGQCMPAWDEEFSPGVGAADAGIFAFVEFNDGSGTALYAGGFFFNIDGQPANGFARWNGEEWTPLGLGFADGTIEALAVFDDGTGPAIYAGGNFSTIGGVSANHIARYDHINDTWEDVGGGPDTISFQVREMLVFDDALYVVGATSGAISFPGVEFWDGESWTAIGSSATLNNAHSAVVFDDALYVGGSAVALGPSVEKWDGENWTIVGSGLGSSNVLSLAVFDGTIYAGTFCASGSDISACVHRWDGGTTWSGAAGSTPYIIERPAPGPAVRALHVADDGTGEALYAGGQIIHGPPFGTNIARFDGTDWSRMPFGVFTFDGVQIMGVVNRIYGHHDGTGPGVYVGGSFEAAQNEGSSAFFSRGVARWGCFDEVLPDAAQSQVLASAEVISSFGGSVTITVVPRDADAILLSPGREVVINTTAGNLIGSVADLGDGTYTQELEAVLGPAGAEVTAIVDGIALAQSANVVFVPVDPVSSTIEVDPVQTFEGDSGVVTVTPRDDAGSPVGAGFDVVITTTLGDLTGDVVDNGDGTYSQTILATNVGTASISATVDGLALDSSASLGVIDPANIGEVIGVDNEGNFIAYVSIQQAVDSSDDDEVSVIFISPGTYEETIQVDGRTGLEVVGLSATEAVVVRGFVISDSENVQFRALDIDASGGPNNAVHLRGGPRSSSGITIINSVITGASHNGIAIDRENGDVLIEGSVIVGNGRNGVDCHLSGGVYTLIGNTISENGHNGVFIGRDVEIVLIENTITGNGTAGGQGGGRYGINRQRKPHGGTPEDVTLIQNVIEDNNGTPKEGSADENVNNFDQIIDETDDQPPYTD